MPALPQVRLPRGGSQRFEVSLVIRSIAGHQAQRLASVMPLLRLIEIAFGLVKIEAEEILGKTLLQRIEAQRPPIQFHQRMAHARRRHTGCPKQLAAQERIDIAGVLDRVVQVNFLNPVELLAMREFAET